MERAACRRAGHGPAHRPMQSSCSGMWSATHLGHRAEATGPPGGRWLAPSGSREGVRCAFSARAQLMPTGARVVESCRSGPSSWGHVAQAGRNRPVHIYPEAADRIEACAMAAIARAASPLAIDLPWSAGARRKGPCSPAMTWPVRPAGSTDRSARGGVGRPPRWARARCATRSWDSPCRRRGPAGDDHRDTPRTGRSRRPGRDLLDTPGLRRSDDPIERSAFARHSVSCTRRRC